MFIQIFVIIFPILAIVTGGYFYAKKFQPNMEVANTLNLNIFVPALLFSIFTSEDFNLLDYHSLAIGGCVVIIISGLLAIIVSKVFGFNTKTFVPPAMFVNSGNMGLPLALFAFGKAAIPAAVVLFFIENTLHFTLGIKIIDRKSSIINVLRIPMVVASLVGVAISLVQYNMPELIITPIRMIGEIAIPLLLFSLGVRLIDIDFNDWKIGIVGAICRPLVGIFSVLLILPWLSLNEINSAQLIIFAILPPAVLNFMVSEKYNQEPKKVASIVLIGNVFSIISVPIALYFLLPGIS
ncbi:MAG: AEC family transporter [Gammaproteobacteria bacterium]|nr:AEC family transporter [Gammaproteobacteria bacterium]